MPDRSSAPVLFPSRLAREQAGLMLHQAARRLRITSDYLARCERDGFPYVLAKRAARLYGSDLTAFLPRSDRYHRNLNDHY